MGMNPLKEMRREPRYIATAAGPAHRLGHQQPGRIERVRFRVAAADSCFMRRSQVLREQPNRKIKCVLCPRSCVIDDRERGYCGVRENRGGTYYTLVTPACARRTSTRREETILSFLSGNAGLLHRHGGLQRELQDVPELEISQARPEQVESRYLPRASGVSGEAERLPVDRLHLQRADHLL